MEIRQSFAKTRDCTIGKKTISDKFGFFFAEHYQSFLMVVFHLKKSEKQCQKNYLKNFVKNKTFLT